MPKQALPRAWQRKTVGRCRSSAQEAPSDTPAAPIRLTGVAAGSTTAKIGWRKASTEGARRYRKQTPSFYAGVDEGDVKSSLRALHSLRRSHARREERSRFSASRAAAARGSARANRAPAARSHW